MHVQTCTSRCMWIGVRIGVGGCNRMHRRKDGYVYGCGYFDSFEGVVATVNVWSTAVGKKGHLNWQQDHCSQPPLQRTMELLG